MFIQYWVKRWSYSVIILATQSAENFHFSKKTTETSNFWLVKEVSNLCILSVKSISHVTNLGVSVLFVLKPGNWIFDKENERNFENRPFLTNGNAVLVLVSSISQPVMNCRVRLNASKPLYRYSPIGQTNWTNCFPYRYTTSGFYRGPNVAERL